VKVADYTKIRMQHETGFTGSCLEILDFKWQTRLSNLKGF